MNAEEIAVSSSPNYVYDRSQQSKILDLLVYKNFDQCIEECSRIVDNAMCLSTDERITSDECEWLCQVCIQAYAELNRWSEVLPLVTQLYNGIEDCPAKVFQSCLLLHASVKDFPTCSAICNIWLKNPNNFGKAEYKIIVELYIAKVLVVLDKWSDIGSFVEKCPGLSSEVQEGYKRHIKTLQRRKEQEEIDKIEEIKETDPSQETGVQTRNYEKQASNTSTNQTEGPVPQGSKLKAVMSKLDDIRRKLLLSNTSQFFQKLALIAFILYLLITKLNFEAGGYNILHQTVTSSNKQNHINVSTKVPTTVEQGIKSEKIQPEKKDYFPGNTALSLQYPNYPVNGTAYSILLKFFGGVLVLIVMAVLVLAVRNKYRLYKKLNAIKGNLDDPRPVWTFESPRVPKSCTPGWAKDIEGPGISYVNSRTLRFVALRKDISITAAIYNVGMSSGKHVFACMWPRNQKYIKKGYLSIGLGQQSVEMYVEFSDYLLGATRDSLGFDLLKNAIYFDGKKIVSYPRGRSRGNALPTLFYMYVDMDKYKLWFASETEFWGVAINFKDLCTNSSTLVYPMVACRGVEGKFMLFYKGEVFATPPETEDTSLKQAESSGRKRYHYDILECIKQELKHSSDIRSIENRHGSLSTRKTDEDKLQTSFVYHNPAFELSRNSEPSTSFEEKFNVKSLENQKWESIRSEKETTLTSQQRLNNNSLVKKPCDKMKLPVISASCSGVQTIAFSGTCTYSKFNSGNSKDVGVEFCSVQDNQGFTDDEGNMYITSYL